MLTTTPKSYGYVMRLLITAERRAKKLMDEGKYSEALESIKYAQGVADALTNLFSEEDLDAMVKVGHSHPEWDKAVLIEWEYKVKDLL